MTKKLYLFLAFFLLTSAIVTAQRPYIRSHNFTTREGLASNVVNTIIQDRQGYLWLGTNHGLTRFDGHRFENFFVDENGEKRIEGITHIVEDTTRNVLLMSGKDYRLLCFDLAQMQFISSDVATICTGMAASMAAVLLVAGAEGKRSALTHSRVMIHQPMGGAQGQASDIEITAREIQKLKKELYTIIANHSHTDFDKVWADSDRDYWMTAQEAKEYGMIDQVLAKKQ